MDLREFIDVLRRRWRIVMVCGLLGLAAAVAVTVMTPPTYTAKAQLFVATNDKDSADAYAGGLFTQQRVKSYTRIANSPTVLEAVIAELDLKTTTGQLAKKISAQAPLDTTLVDIRVQERSAARAQAIADETAVQFTKYIDSIEKAASDAPPVIKASVVGEPGPPSAPTSPRPALNLAIGLLCGLVVGITGAVLRQSLDTTVRSAGDVRRRLGLPEVGALPKPVRRGAHTGPVAGGTPRDEALSQLRARLPSSASSSDGRVPSSLLIASALPREGRTATALDLAVNVARTGRRVVLVEADLRRPQLARTLGLAGTAGLADVLTGEAPLDGALQSWGDGLLRVLAAGTPAPDPSALLSSPRMTQLLRTLESDADLVVLDSPPLLPYADAAILAPATEAVLLVLRAGKIRYGLAHRALESLTSVHARVMGAVLTDVPAERFPGRRPGSEARERSHAPVSDRRPAPVPDGEPGRVSAGVRSPAGHRR
ncbi:Wzz/FepE/Etk N-terminal domain-containing protein [Streptomyces olindensis]|uniref:Wzz/FepE/Etk N-terminal domain-containing protein n=1 Tax=Streptomyces olindensis TaxID=358823 RepID=UPI00365622CB